MPGQVSKPRYLRNQGWTRLEVAILLLALAFLITSGILLATKGGASWALIVGSVLVATLGLMRYRTETEQERTADDQGE
jgi:hypothetical protein